MAKKLSNKQAIYKRLTKAQKRLVNARKRRGKQIRSEATLGYHRDYL